ncbi:MAG TPA: hypothetical protein VN457_03545, partial [Chlamydiales bacterium]|nr:hypothetical protein [Chlamydiales bacterium]
MKEDMKYLQRPEDKEPKEPDVSELQYVDLHWKGSLQYKGKLNMRALLMARSEKEGWAWSMQTYPADLLKKAETAVAKDNLVSQVNVCLRKVFDDLAIDGIYKKENLTVVSPQGELALPAETLRLEESVSIDGKPKKYRFEYLKELLKTIRTDPAAVIGEGKRFGKINEKEKRLLIYALQNIINIGIARARIQEYAAWQKEGGGQKPPLQLPKQRTPIPDDFAMPRNEPGSELMHPVHRIGALSISSGEVVAAKPLRGKVRAASVRVAEAAVPIALVAPRVLAKREPSLLLQEVAGEQSVLAPALLQQHVGLVPGFAPGLAPGLAPGSQKMETILGGLKGASGVETSVKLSRAVQAIANDLSVIQMASFNAISDAELSTPGAAVAAFSQVSENLKTYVSGRISKAANDDQKEDLVRLLYHTAVQCCIEKRDFASAGALFSTLEELAKGDRLVAATLNDLMVHDPSVVKALKQGDIHYVLHLQEEADAKMAGKPFIPPASFLSQANAA